MELIGLSPVDPVQLESEMTLKKNQTHKLQNEVPLLASASAGWLMTQITSNIAEENIKERLVSNFQNTAACYCFPFPIPFAYYLSISHFFGITQNKRETD